MIDWQKARTRIILLLPNNVKTSNAGQTLGRRATGAATLTNTCHPRIEEVISLVLRYGVVVSSILIAIGVIEFLRSLDNSVGWPTITAVLSGTGGAERFNSPDQVLAGLPRGNANAMITLGLLVLMVTPIMSVALSLGQFLLEKDRSYIFITLFVLIVLTVSFVIGAQR